MTHQVEQTAAVRVLHASATAQLGGAERVLLDCLVACLRNAQTATVLTLGTGPLLQELERIGISAAAVNVPPAIEGVGDAFGSRLEVVAGIVRAVWSVRGVTRQISNRILEARADVIHSHGIKTHVLVAIANPAAPVVWHLHDYISGRQAAARILRCLSSRCAAAIAVSHSVAEDARRMLPARVPITVIHNAVDCDRFRPDGAAVDLDALAGLPSAPPGTLRIGFPATFARWKGHEVFLDAFACLRATGVRAYIIGAPVYTTSRSQWTQAELRQRVRARNLEARVGFTGFIDDMAPVYRSLDIVVHASTRPEPFGLVIVEAMACGRAVVAVPFGGAAELFVDGEHALAARNPDSLAAALARLADDPVLRSSLGRNARAHVLAEFSPQRFDAELQVVYRNAVL